MNGNKDWTKFWKFVAAFALAFSAFAVTLAGIETFTVSEEAVPRSDYQCDVYTEQGCAKFVIADGGEIEVQSGGTMDVQSGATTTFGGDVTLQNDETIGNSTDGLISFGGGIIFNTTTITVTDGQTITPTLYSGYRLNAAGAVTITLAVCSSDFQLLLLFGEDAQTITINDTNVRTNDGGVQTLGQYDLITWMCIDAEWVELSDSVNS